MTAPNLSRARVKKLDRQGNPTDEEQRFDFNPETLTFKVQHEKKTTGRETNQRVQYTGASTITLSFEAWFDMTRPPDESSPAGGAQGAGSGSGAGSSPESRDVRNKTKIFTGVLRQSRDRDDASGSFFPSMVQFEWGNIIFKGLVESFQETLDFFSQEGVPLRSKVAVTLTTLSRDYRVTSDQVQEEQAAAGTGGAGGDGVGGGSGAGAGGAAGPGGLSLDLDAGFSLDIDVGLDIGLGIGLDVDVDLGVGVDLSVSASASVSLGASASIDVFGGAAVQASLGVDAPAALQGRAGGAAGSSTAKPASGKASVGQPRTSAAPDGPVAGSGAAALATAIQRNRALGISPANQPPSSAHFVALALPDRSGPALPVRGSPPQVMAPALQVQGSALVPERPRLLPVAASGLGRPSWEVIADAALPPAAAPPRRCTACGRHVTAPAPCGCGGR